jgi:uncharacterized SAM-binding protein YcdF (DUF218 family)
MFFELSKLFWLLAQPLNALCLVGLLGLAARLVWPRTGQAMMTFALCAILFFGIVPVGPLMMVWLEKQFPQPRTLPDKIDGIILLGGAFESYLTQKTGHIVANDNIERALCFVEMARRYPDAKLVFSGGSGDILNPDAMEAYDARAFFRLTQLNRNVIYEEESRNTYENALYTKKTVSPQPGERWLLATSAYHMPRSIGVFEQAGWSVIPYPCDPRSDGSYNVFHRLPSASGNFSALNISMKEMIGLVVYYVTGKSAFILPPAQVRSRYDILS